jgi:hypothetical protein
MNLQEAWKKRWTRIVFALSVLAGLGTTLSYRWHRERVAEASRAAGAYCDRGIGAAKARMVTAPMTTATAVVLHSSLDPDEPGVKKRVHRGEAKTLPGNSAQAAVPSSR